MDIAQSLAEIARIGQKYLQNTNPEDNAARLELIEVANSIVEKLRTPREFYVETMVYDTTRLSALRVAIESGVLAKLNLDTPLTSTELAAGIVADSALTGKS